MKRFTEIKGNFGFGLMRLPMLGELVDAEQVKVMADKFIAAGFNYFDTAHGYIGGKSELAFKECVALRHDRSEFLIADKLSKNYFNSNADIRPLFAEQLKACGVDYFDFYLMHSQSTKTYPHFKANKAYETAAELKAEGRIKHLGISFHDTPDVLEMILKENPCIEFVQIQLNYADYEDSMVCARKNYEVCVAHNLPVRVMEPVKGGYLANVGDDIKAIFKKAGEGSPASFALRFAASLPQVEVVLSGMSTIEQLEDNVSFMQDFKPLSENEKEIVEEARIALLNTKNIPCTACRYCFEVCPINMPIPELFSLMNAKNQFEASWDYNLKKYYEETTKGRALASECLRCGACENICPQHIAIRERLEDVVKEIEEA